MIGAIVRRVGLVAFTLSGFVILVYDVEITPIVPMIVLSVFAMFRLFAEAPKVGVTTLIFAFAALVMIPPVHGYSCKARQSEAKTNLSGLFTAQKSFFSEYGAYTTDLNSLVWFPDGSPLYLYGFADKGGPDEKYMREIIHSYDRGRRHTLDLGVQFAIDGTARYSTAKMFTTDGNRLEETMLPVQAVIRGHPPHYGFMAGAAGDIDTDESAVELDVWTISAQRKLKVVANDCAS